jgi:Ser/Thr protein kinase RdoA (MazF antagonist)
MFGGKQSLPPSISILAAEPLLRVAREHYDIDREATCELAHHGVNDTYVISEPRQKFALRVYREGWRDQDDIQWELALLEHLDSEGAPVAPPLRTRSGNRFAVVLAPEGPRAVALFRFAPGKQFPADVMTLPHARAIGRALAAVHLRMDTYEPPYTRFELDLDHLLSSPLNALEPLMASRKQDLAYLRCLTGEIREGVAGFEARGLARGVCHGDVTTANALLDQRGEYTFLDFDSSGSGWRTYDIATFRWEMLRACEERRKADENYCAFLEGYREVRSFEKLDEDAVPAFVAAREIWRMGLHAVLGAEIGQLTLDDRYFERAIGFLHDISKEMPVLSATPVSSVANPF